MTKYAEAGVDLALGDSIKNKIKEMIRSTFTTDVLSEGGEFGGVFRIPGSDLSIVSSIDGVGTKLKVAFLANKHDSIGKDLVNHCVNDICVMGAKPAFFLDYLATGELHPNVIQDVISGLAGACRQHSIALIAGETAQMPGIYNKGEYDLAGAIIGFLEYKRQLPKSDIVPGDKIIGFISNGLHTNGYSLARKIIFQDNDWTVNTYQEELGCSWGEELLRVHKSYYEIIEGLIDNKLTKGLAHVTGGGIAGNLIRIMPNHIEAIIDTKSVPVLPIFNILRESGNVPLPEMYDVFNMGIGLVSISSPEASENIFKHYQDDAVFLGELYKNETSKTVSLIY